MNDVTASPLRCAVKPLPTSYSVSSTSKTIVVISAIDLSMLLTESESSAAESRRPGHLAALFVARCVDPYTFCRSLGTRVATGRTRS
eukprot:4578809-Prymnesium_polylepis.2